MFLSNSNNIKEVMLFPQMKPIGHGEKKDEEEAETAE